MVPTPTSTTTATEAGLGSAVSAGTGRRVLVVFHEETSGGATLSVLRLIGLLEQAGWSFGFFLARPSPLYDQLEADGYPVWGAPRHVCYSLRALRLPPGPTRRIASIRPYFKAFRAALSQFDPALVHLNSLDTMAELAVTRRAGRRTVFHVHEMIGKSPKSRLARRLLYRWADAVVAVSVASAERLAVAGRTPELAYESAPIPVRSLRRDDCAGRPIAVGSVGVISRRKGSDLVVAAAERLRGKPIEFELVGSPTDPLDADWGLAVLERAASAGITLTGRADIPKRLAAWDIFVLPSRIDPFPISVLEAMAAGLPVVGTAVDGIVEQLAAGAGVLVDGEDPIALAAAIESLAGDPARRQRLGEMARRRVIDHYSHAHQAAAIAAVYQRVVESAGSAARC